MNTNCKRISPLRCLCDENHRKRFALIVADFNVDVYEKRCPKINEFIKIMWKDALYQTCTLNDQEIEVSSLFLVQNQSSSSCEMSSKMKSLRIQPDLWSCYDSIIQKIKQGQLDVDCILIASNDTFSSHRMLHYIQMMYSCQEVLQSHDILISGVFNHSYVCILPEGSSELDVNTGCEGKWCGLVPFGDAVKLTTTGLVWNLNDDFLQFNGLISSSNELDGSKKVNVTSDKNVVWTMDIKCSDCHLS